MWKKASFLLAVLALALFAAGCGGRTNEFGYVDLQKVTQDSNKVKSIQAKIDQKAQEVATQNEQDAALFEKEKGTLSKDAVEKRQQQLDERRQLRQSELMVVSRDAQEEFRNLLNQAMGELAKEKGLGAVLPKNNVLYGGIDITDDLIKKIN